MTNNNIHITKDGSATIKHAILGEYYHSLHGAFTESMHIFIKNGLAFYAQQHKKEAIAVFEMGLGSGLNALLAYLWANKNKTNLRYTAIEAFPISQEVVTELNFEKQIGISGSNEITAQIASLEAGMAHNLSTYFSIQVVHAEFEKFETAQTFDVCFYDAFAPIAQPELWTVQIFEKLYNILNTGGILTTYCAKGQVKRDLTTVGFSIESLVGPPGKREITRAIKY